MAPTTSSSCNPPFHGQGRAERPDIGRRFIAVAAQALKPGGRLWLVANRHLPYEAELEARFGKVRTVAQQGGFKVVETVRSSDRTTAMKLVKLIANLGYGSRRDVAAMFREGRITDPQGEVLYADDKVPFEAVRVDGEAARPARGPDADAAQAGGLHVFDEGPRTRRSTTCCRRASACVRRCCPASAGSTATPAACC